ncbi:hypothetical protein F2Q69_00058947 [Brassica cretica]|uniref:Uncharacterized protein n=1 Tax=Brassica cretica TaxID=69181 RepID=A0A8S9RMS2_BRACR|nr:hypothetical protein F2Q69_00058947 [Brassica cretica]
MEKSTKDRKEKRKKQKASHDKKIEELKHKLRERNEELSFIQFPFHLKEGELEISIAAKRLEQENLRETEANLKKHTEEWLIAQDEKPMWKMRARE